MLFGIDRTTLAYGIIVFLVAIGVPLLIRHRHRRRREKLRRRGIKTYGH